MKRTLLMVTSLVMALLILMTIAGTAYAANLESEGYTSKNPFYPTYHGQCTWYCWGRAYEKLGISLPYRGNAGTWLGAASNKGTTPRENSIAVWTGGAYGHVAFVESVSGNNVYVSESNFAGRLYNERNIANDPPDGYIYLTGSGQPSVEFSSWENGNYTYIDKTDASIGQEINVSGGTCTDTGMVLYDQTGKELARANNGYYYYRVYFKINEELHYTLSPATTYKYKFFAIVDGKTYWSNEQSFTTVNPCANGHKGPFQYKTKTAATCVTAGSKEKYCETCGKVADTETIPALGHDWGEWVRTLEPTATTKGTETRTCKRDASHIETRDIPPIAPSLSAVLSASASSIGKDGTFTVTVSLQNNPGIAAMTLSYALSGNTGTLEKAEAAGIASGAVVSASARISLMSAQDITGDGNILILTFKVNEVKNTTVTISCDKAANADQAIVTVSGASASAQAVKRIPGDANDDGFVDIVDAMMVLRYDSGWGVNINKSNSDVNGDGAVDIIDAMMILRYDSGWNVTLV